MASNDRTLTPLDSVIGHTDQALRAIFATPVARRPYPAEGVSETVTAPQDRRRIASLMRINHAGEIAAQALYHGQSVTARLGETREAMLDAAHEETDHLAWCATRIAELGGRRSLLDPFWYAGSFMVGALAGVVGDRTSLGFVAETERQVVEHLQSHLAQLPADDRRTRAVLEQMTRDEAHHGHTALEAGGITLPTPVRALMKATARIMTSTARWL